MTDRSPERRTPRRHSADEADLVVVGAGVARLASALSAADRGARVIVLSKGALDVSASYLAQGGVNGSADGSEGRDGAEADDRARRPHYGAVHALE